MATIKNKATVIMGEVENVAICRLAPDLLILCLEREMEQMKSLWHVDTYAQVTASGEPLAAVGNNSTGQWFQSSE